MNDNDPETTRSARLGVGGWLVIAVLVGLLGWACWYAVEAWNALEGVGISATGWVLIVMGILLTVGLGAGLMALVFYSSRKGIDR
ncbi:MAG TPA: hypothetical protein VHC42_13270 [Rhizomicrobium sp.]|nr:hypothetical protein [Rhizomicrobium sp.]